MTEHHVFETDRDYLNVYFMSVDAAGHSSIVRHNDADAADYAFDRFERLVYNAVDDAVAIHRCRYAQFWGWRGDGGLCVFYDPDESSARKAALASASAILGELDSLNEKVGQRGLHGEIHVRIALHKGGLRYKGDDKRGSIHSAALNFCAHLEKAAPRDTVAVSDDIYNLMGDEQRLFVRTGLTYEGHEVALKSARPEEEILDEWRDNVAPSHKAAVLLRTDLRPTRLGLIGCYSNRTVTDVYSEVLDGAKDVIWAAAIGMGGLQSDHRALIEAKVEQGVDVRLLSLEPDPVVAAVLVDGATLSLPAWYDRVSSQGNYCQEKVEALRGWVHAINDSVKRKTNDPNRVIRVRLSRVFPAGALFIVDRTAFFSPYLAHDHNLKMPSFQCAQGGMLYEKFYSSFVHIWQSDLLSRPYAAVTDKEQVER